MNRLVRLTLFIAIILTLDGCGNKCRYLDFRSYIDRSKDVHAFGLVNDTLHVGDSIDFQLNIRDTNLYPESGLSEITFYPYYNINLFRGNKVLTTKGSYENDRMIAEYNPANDVYEFHAIVTLERIGLHQINLVFGSEEFRSQVLCFDGEAGVFLNPLWYINADGSQVNFYVVE